MRRPVRGLVTIAVAWAVSLLTGCGSSVPTIESATAAYQSGGFTEAAKLCRAILAENPSDQVVQRLLARSLGRSGQATDAVRLLAPLGAGMLTAEDLLLMSRGLDKQDRPLLSRLALEAAQRVDPKNREVSAEQLKRPAAPARLARFSGIASGPALAELVATLAVHEREGAEPGRLLAAVLRRDRSTLAALTNPDASRKLLARIFLEEGLIAEAKAQLARVESQTDLEAHWLTSRVELLNGRPTEALAAWKRSRNYRIDHPTEHEPGRYAGAESCRECHSDIYSTQQSSLHSKTLTRSADLAKVPLPSQPVVDPENKSVVHTFHRDGSTIELETRVKDQTVKALIDYALGSGHLGVTMLARQPGVGHRSLRLSYYRGGDHWGLTTGFEPLPSQPENYIGELLSDDAFVKCINCHSTRFVSEAASPGPEAADRGIGCERCHGPGANHIRAIEADFTDLAIARPKIATPAQRFGVCVECHGADGVIPPSDPRFIRFQGAILPYSRCFTESGKKLDCVSCHSPHKNLETRPEAYEARCLACHSATPTEKTVARKLRIEAVQAGVCKVNSKTGCIACHMPKVENAMPFTKFTDHHIRIHRPNPSVNKTAE